MPVAPTITSSSTHARAREQTANRTCSGSGRPVGAIPGASCAIGFANYSAVVLRAAQFALYLRSASFSGGARYLGWLNSLDGGFLEC
jgi:hypothetical protein